MFFLRIAFIIFLLFNFKIFNEKPEKVIDAKEPSSPYTVGNTPWADSVFNSLTFDERIAQLFMVAAFLIKTRGMRRKLPIWSPVIMSEGSYFSRAVPPGRFWKPIITSRKPRLRW
jgi:hypothetical protein